MTTKASQQRKSDNPMLMPGRSYSALGENYRFGFNGKELDQNGEFGSLNHYDHGSRIHCAPCGRFLSVDRMSFTYPHLSPYAFVGNNPIINQEIDGDIFGTVIGGVIGGIRAKRRGEKVWKGVLKGAAAGAVADLTAAVVVLTAPVSAPALGVAAAAGAAAGGVGAAADGLIWEGKVNAKNVVAGTVIGGLTGGIGYKLASGFRKLRELRKTAIEVDPNQIKGTLIDDIAGGEYLDEGLRMTPQLVAPKGLNQSEWQKVSNILNEGLAEISDDITIQGSRVTGANRLDSDIDIAVKLSADAYEELVHKAFANAKEGTALWRSYEYALREGKLTPRRAGPYKSILKRVRKTLTEYLGTNTSIKKADISIIKKGGNFDNGTQMSTLKTN